MVGSARVFVSGRFRGADVFADQPLLEHNK